MLRAGLGMRASGGALRKSENCSTMKEKRMMIQMKMANKRAGEQLPQETSAEGTRSLKFCGTSDRPKGASEPVSACWYEISKPTGRSYRRFHFISTLDHMLSGRK